MNSVLAFAGRRGPLLLFFGVLCGFVFPGLAAAAKPWMGASVFVFTLGAFLRGQVPGPLDTAACWTNARHHTRRTHGDALTTAAHPQRKVTG